MPGYYSVDAEQLNVVRSSEGVLLEEAQVQVTVRSLDGFKGYVTMVYSGSPTPDYIAPDTHTMYIPQNGSKADLVLVGHSGGLTFTARGYWNGSYIEDSIEVS